MSLCFGGGKQRDCYVLRVMFRLPCTSMLQLVLRSCVYQRLMLSARPALRTAWNQLMNTQPSLLILTPVSRFIRRQ